LKSERVPTVLRTRKNLRHITISSGVWTAQENCDTDHESGPN